MTQVRNIPTVQQFEELSRPGTDDKIVGRGDDIAAKGSLGAFLAGSSARVAAMDNFITAVAAEYGQEVGKLAATMLAAPKAEHMALKGSMVRDVLAACRNETQRIQDYNRGMVGESSPAVIARLGQDIADQMHLDEEGLDTVKEFLERRLPQIIADSKEPLTESALMQALYAASSQDLGDLLYFMGASDKASNESITEQKQIFHDLPPLACLELSRALGSGQSELCMHVVRENLHAIQAAAGPGNPITRAAVLEGLSGAPVPADFDTANETAFKDELAQAVEAKLFGNRPNIPQENRGLVTTCIDMALSKNVSYDAIKAAMAGGRAITLEDFTGPISLGLGKYNLDDLDNTTDTLCRDLSRRGGLADSFANNSAFNSTITFNQPDGDPFAVNLSDPTTSVPMTDDQLAAYKGGSPNAVGTAIKDHALQLCNGNRRQAAALVAALGQQSMVWCRHVSPIIGSIAGSRSLGEHSPANFTVTRLESGVIEIAVRSLNPDRPQYSMTCHIQPDGSAPITMFEMGPPA